MCGDAEMEGGCRRCKEWVGDGLEMVRSVKEMTGNGFGYRVTGKQVYWQGNSNKLGKTWLVLRSLMTFHP
jgi:hypothetical protein